MNARQVLALVVATFLSCGCFALAKPGSMGVGKVLSDAEKFDGEVVSIHGCLLYVEDGISALAADCPREISRNYNEYSDRVIDITTTMDLSAYALREVIVEGRYKAYSQRHGLDRINLRAVSRHGELEVSKVAAGD